SAKFLATRNSHARGLRMVSPFSHCFQSRRKDSWAISRAVSASIQRAYATAQTSRLCRSYSASKSAWRDSAVGGLDFMVFLFTRLQPAGWRNLHRSILLMDDERQHF